MCGELAGDLIPGYAARLKLLDLHELLLDLDLELLEGLGSREVHAVHEERRGAGRAKLDRRKLAKDDSAMDYPKIKDGIRGMAFIEAVVKSSKNNARWTKLNV